MQPAEYQVWQQAVTGWLERHSDQEQPGAGQGLAEGLAKNIGQVLDQARVVVRAINANLGGQEVTDRNSYDFTLEWLPSILGFSEFSLAEYTYPASPEGRPGVRLWLQEEGGQHSVSLLLFPDVVQWRVDEHGRKICSLLLSLEMEGEEPTALIPSAWQEYFPGPWTWRQCLLQALCLPLLDRPWAEFEDASPSHELL